jgi:hypothetical protein
MKGFLQTFPINPQPVVSVLMASADFTGVNAPFLIRVMAFGAIVI